MRQESEYYVLVALICGSSYLLNSNPRVGEPASSAYQSMISHDLESQNP